MLAMVCAACDATPSGPGETATLRVVNQGPHAIQGLALLFPQERVAFGDVAAGQTTPDRPVTRGVYRYAAFAYQVNGTERVQPVIDWVGESPMAGQAFTYTIAVADTSTSNLPVTIVSVVRDK